MCIRDRCDGCFDAADIDVVGVGVWFDRHGFGARLRHRQPCRNERVAGNDHLIPRTDVHSSQNEFECLQAVRHANTVPDSAICCELGFKGLALAAEDELPGIHDTDICSVELRPTLCVLCCQIQEGYSHGFGTSTAFRNAA